MSAELNGDLQFYLTKTRFVDCIFDILDQNCRSQNQLPMLSGSALKVKWCLIYNEALM